MNRLWWLALCWTVGACAEGLDGRPKPEEYPVRATAGDLTIGAEYLMRSVPTPRGMHLTTNYLVVEVKLFLPRPQARQVAASHFRLRMNGKRELLPQPASFVAAELKYPGWEQNGPVLQAGGGIGDRGVLIGGVPRTERFPGDPTSQQRLPRAPRAPQPEDRSGVERLEPVSPADAVRDAALPEGEKVLPVAGLLFFPYSGKLKPIQRLTLIYETQAGSAQLELIPAR